MYTLFKEYQGFPLCHWKRILPEEYMGSVENWVSLLKNDLVLITDPLYEEDDESRASRLPDIVSSGVFVTVFASSLLTDVLIGSSKEYGKRKAKSILNIIRTFFK